MIIEHILLFAGLAGASMTVGAGLVIGAAITLQFLGGINITTREIKQTKGDAS